MVNIGLCCEALEDFARPGIGQQPAGEGDKRLVNIVVRNGRSDALQISTRHKSPGRWEGCQSEMGPDPMMPVACGERAPTPPILLLLWIWMQDRSRHDAESVDENSPRLHADVPIET